MIEFSNVSFSNKGDCLMLLAAQDALTSRLGQVAFTTRSRELTAAEMSQFELTRLNYPAGNRLLQKSGILRNRLLANRFLGKAMARMSGRTAFSEVQAVLHVSGYAHADIWGKRMIERDIALVRDAKRKNRKIIFLPKTYGPFAATRDVARELFEMPDLLFARDRVSYANLIDLGIDQRRLQLATDYTGACRGIADERHDSLAGRACIIPNYRVVDMLPDDESEAYIDFLTRLARSLQDRGLAPFLLVHETASDPQIARRMQQPSLPVITEPHPLKLKSIAGRSRIVISSRLHGAINGLSQGVPTIAVGWAHKYYEIMRDYGVADYNLDWGPDVFAQLTSAIGRLLDNPEESARVQSVLRTGQSRIDAINSQMWDRIERELAAD